ncbi:helix-turn-helix domain-containing protein [Hoeflea sp. EC-HK425]|uniref:MarR family transcriptional regulator n=1 Tax=Hoeflea sp. EC-HK425 TaxID=2038388 RepID=UPI0012528176|nr:helix-turn-helix domain-containing protein [Hoeflea sp. EC-HK425]VVT15209.1 conserved hypothetical protein [Hoeflea sp. EC-HK425]
MVETVMMTLSEIAERDGISRQAISKTVRELIAKHEIPVERDSRDRIVRVSVAHIDHYRGKFQNPAKVMASRPSVSGEKPKRGDTTASETDADSFEEARRRNEWLRYSRLKLEHDEACGKLIRAELVEAALDSLGREAQALVARLPNHADDLSVPFAKEGVHGLRLALREVAHKINLSIAEKFKEIAAAAPDKDVIEDEEAGL